MKRFLLFAGNGNSNAQGINGLVGDYDAVAEAFLSLVDNQVPSTWWHILDTHTGEVIEREHLRAKDSTLSFAKSDRIVGVSMPRVRGPAAGEAPERTRAEHSQRRRDLREGERPGGRRPRLRPFRPHSIEATAAPGTDPPGAVLFCRGAARRYFAGLSPWRRKAGT